jgi:hypothetical protein
MLGSRHEILLYAPEGEPPAGVTLVPCLTDDERQAIFGEDDPNRLPDWPTNEQSLPFNLNVIQNLREQVHHGDIVLLVAGRGAQIITAALPKFLYAEPFVGYEGILDNTHRAFESYAWMHAVYGRKQIKDIAWFDTVIPPFCDLGDFPIVNEGNGEYLLFLGRLIRRKGPHIAAEIAKASGLPLYVAGAGGEMKDGVLYGNGVKLEGVTHLGPVNVQGPRVSHGWSSGLALPDDLPGARRQRCDRGNDGRDAGHHGRLRSFLRNGRAWRQRVPFPNAAGGCRSGKKHRQTGSGKDQSPRRAQLLAGSGRVTVRSLV